MDWKTRIAALFLWIFIFLSASGNGNAEKRVVCYYTNWSVYRPGTAKFSPQNINPYLCTHLIYAFGGFTKENTLKPFDKYQDIEKGGYAKFTGLKTYNKDLKTMLAIGGWNEGSSRFSPMVADPGRRKEFVKNTVKFLRQNHFDGLDLDWEYPAFRDGGKLRDRDNYADLVQELREEFERESSKTGRPRLLLSMAVPAGIEYIDKGYDVPRLNEYLDFINLLSYDYHSAYEPAANHHSPLFPLEEDNEYNYDTELTIDFTISHLLKSGASSEKIVLGIPTYGRSYTLFNEDATEIGAPADGPGEEGDATREKGYLAYYEICESIAKSDEWQVVQPNPSAMGPYAFRGNQWVGYDDENIVRAKARYVNEKKLGGIMFWSIDNDDFRGKCHGRPYPLIEAAKEAMLVEDEKSSSGTKTKVLDSRKKGRPQGGQRPQVNSISRKFKTGRRTTTTETPSTRRRISSGSRSNSRSNGRSRGTEDSEDDEEDNEEEANSVKSSDKPRQRPRGKNTRLRNQSLGGGRKKQESSRNHEEKNEEPEEETRSKKMTTPEPPTTPDPGTDFKCEDEGFFPHPRDCKKYFWCLDSGPSGLGIVAHQFTCPSGLLFNKAADSCDYPRNVACPKTKTTQSAVTTTRAPITAATSRTTYLHKPTPRTTTPKTDSEEEYEYYDDEEVDEDAPDSREIEEQARSTTTPKTYKTISRNRPTTTNSPPTTTTTTQLTTSTKAYKITTEKDTSYEDEEDPRVIKELIDLIKKAGGIEQLEKQLLYQDKSSGGNAETTEGNGKSTPATISRSLYERVLNRQATRIAGGFLGSFSTTQSSKSPKAEENAQKNSRTRFINGPGGAQFEGLDQVPEVKTLRRTTKHQYVTIDRQRQTTSESPADEDEELDEEDEEDNKNVASSEDRAVSSSQEKSSNRRFTPSYFNIRRSRPSTTTSENDVDLKDEGDDTLDEELGESGEDELEEPVTEGRTVVKSDEETTTPKSRYTNVQRFRSTTLRYSVEDATEESSLKKNEKSVSTTTEKMIPVTEEVAEISSTSSEPSSPESLENEKEENSTQQSNSDDAPSSPEAETTNIKKDGTLRLVENSATEILFTTVPASSISTGSNYDSFTRGPIVAAVSQPRPFGFSRRGRPTTTAIPPTTATATEQTRTKVDSEALRLPTLKELVGLTFSTLSTSQLVKSATTTPSIDTTKVSDQRDESEEGELLKNQVVDDRFDFYNLVSTTTTTTPKEREILDNDILSSEEIERRSSSASGSKIEAENEPEKVEVPVRILDDTNGEEIAELVLLRVPQSKLSSAALKPILRVKILGQEDQEVVGGPGGKKKVVKVENSSELSSENELYDTFRSTSARRRTVSSSRAVQDAEAGQDRPRSRQKIVKARRRSRPVQAQGQEDQVKKTQNDESPRSRGQKVVRKITRRRENPEKTAQDTTTLTPEVSEPIFITLSPTTLTESDSIPSRASNLTRGFYITKDIDESPTTLDPMTTEYQSTFSDDFTSQEIDFTSQEIESTTQTPTTRDIDVTSQGDETLTPQERTEYTTESEGIAVARTTSIDSIESIESSVEDQQPTTSLETATPDYVSTIIAETTESLVPTTEGRIINEPAITTFRPRIPERATTPDPTASTTTEFSTSSSEELEDRAVTNPEGRSEDRSESLKTSENNYWGSTTMAEPSTTDEQSKTSSTISDEHLGTQTRIFEAENFAGATKIISDQNEISVTAETEKFDGETSTTPVQSSLDPFNEKPEPEVEKSSQKTSTNVDAITTTRQATTNRGGVRFTTTVKSPVPIDGSSSRSQTQKPIGDNLVPSTNPETTKSYVSIGRTIRKQETTGSETNDLPPTTPTSRRRGSSRKTTRPSKITETTRKPSSPRESTKKNVATSVNDRSTFTTNNYDQTIVARTKNSRASSRGRPNDRRTTEAPEIHETGSGSVTPRIASLRSTTAAYGETLEGSTRAESSYGTTDFETETTSISETSKSLFQVSGEPENVSESLESRANVIDTSESSETVPGTTETVATTSGSEEMSTNTENYEIGSTKSFDSLDASSSTVSTSSDSSPDVTSSKFIEETSEPTTFSVSTISPSTNFVQEIESDASSSQSSVSGPETTRSILSENSSNYSTSADEISTEISATTKNYEETLSPAPTTVFPATQSTGSTDDSSDKSTTLDDETNTFSRTIEPLGKNTGAGNSEDTSQTYGATTFEAKETTSGYEGASIPWLVIPGNENVDIRETTMVNTLEILQSTTASYVKNDSHSLVTNFPIEGPKTQKEILRETGNDVTTEANNRKTIFGNDTSGKSFSTTMKIDVTTRATNPPEIESFLQNVIPRRATWTTRNNENSVSSRGGASSTSQPPIGQQGTKRPRGRVRFTNFAGISDDANEEQRRPIKQLVVRRRLAKDGQRVVTTTESNLIKTKTSPVEKNQKTRFSRIKNVSVRPDVEKENKIDGSENQNELADRGLNEKSNSSKPTRRRVVVYRGRARPENTVTTPRPVTTTTSAPTTVSSGEKVDDDKRRKIRKWRKRIVLKRSRLDAEEDDQSIAETEVVGRALIDGHYVESSPDTGSYIVLPDSPGEANPPKTPGAFLRRPGTLVRNDPLNRLRSKVPKTLVAAPTIVPSAKIQSVDPTYEMKTEDQSVRAQELAVTLSDPPTSDPSSKTGRSGLRKQGTTRKISTTIAPRTESTAAPKTRPIVRQRQSPRRNNNNLGIVETPARPRRPAIIDYDYYVDDEIRLVLKPELKDKLFVTKKGGIRCLDQGNFAHPTSCKKFITCARMGNGQVIGTEYTCPDKLSFDPVGGICNWSAGLGCEDKSKTSK